MSQKTLNPEEALEKILAKIAMINPAVDIVRAEIIAHKTIINVLDYCHREDFPEALIYSVVGALDKKFPAEDSEVIGGNIAPLSEIKMDDTTFKFAVAAKDATIDDATALFETLKPDLRIYRKAVGL